MMCMPKRCVVRDVLAMTSKHDKADDISVVVASTTYPSTMERSVGQSNDGARAGLGNKHANTRDVPRFRALVMRDRKSVV